MAKIKIYLIAAGIVLVLAFVVSWNIEHQGRIRERERANRLAENQRQMLDDSIKYAKLTLSLNEFKKSMSHKVDSILDAMRIKAKQVTSVVERHYYYHNSDTLFYRPNAVETDTGRLYPFVDVKDCFTFAGFMEVNNNRPELSVTKREFNNNSVDIAYLERPHKFLFIHWGKWRAKLKSVNQCGDATIKEIQVIK